MSSALHPGQTFGRYQVARTIGVGSFGIVYEAVQYPLGRRVALKLLHDRTLTHPDAVARFEREAMAAARLRHPHVVEVFDYGTHEGTAFLAMEFLEGESLQALIRRAGPLPETTVCDLLLPIVSAVAAVHEAGVVHRDLKPENILLTVTPEGQWHPKLLDFGIAKVDTQGPELTRTNALLGTPCYMSPEQVMQARTIDGRCDQWSLGVMLYESLTARKPFYSETLLVLMTAITSEEPPPLRALRPDVHPTLEAVVQRCLQRRPDDRFPSMRELGSAMLPFAAPESQHRWYEEFNEESALSYVATSVAANRAVAPAPVAPQGARPSFHTPDDDATHARNEALPPLDEPTELVNTTSQDTEFPQSVVASSSIRASQRLPVATQLDLTADPSFAHSDGVGTGTLVADGDGATMLARGGAQRPPTGRMPPYKSTVEMSSPVIPVGVSIEAPAAQGYGMAPHPMPGDVRSSTVPSMVPAGRLLGPPMVMHGEAGRQTMAMPPPRRGWLLLLSVALLSVGVLVGALWYALRPREETGSVLSGPVASDGAALVPTAAPDVLAAPRAVDASATQVAAIPQAVDASAALATLDAGVPLAVDAAVRTVALDASAAPGETATPRDSRSGDRNERTDRGDRNNRTQRRDAGTRRRQGGGGREGAPIF